MADKQFVIVGLGNPGKRYEKTRHNVGYALVQAFASGLNWTFREEVSFCAKVARGLVEEVSLHLVLPLTYMNESGRALRSYCDYYKLTPRQVIVVCDDIALDFGQLRVRSVGSAGGHNGLKSIEASLHTRHYVRLRIGIGEQTEQHETLADYVLDLFSEQEQQGLGEVMKKGITILECLIQEEVSVVMNAVNKKKENPTVRGGE